MQNSSETSRWFFKNHIIAIIIWGLAILIGILLFSDFSRGATILTEKIDPYVLSTKGKTLIIRDKQLLTVDENTQTSISVGDKIKTLESTATIFWPDGSITRLGEKSSIVIHEMRANSANTGIQIDFSLEQGKSWSNVVKYMFGESYFHERFNNDTSLAAVRGTVFEVNIDRKYIHTIDHAVSVQDIGNSTGSIFIVAGWVFDTETRKAMVREKIDEVWNKANTNADVMYLNERMENLNKAILETVGQKNYLHIFLEKIGIKRETLSLEWLITGDPAKWKQFETAMKAWDNKQELLDIYQQFYGLRNTHTLLDTKMKLRDMIIETAPAEQKQVFLTDFARSTLYDSWNTWSISPQTLEQLKNKLGEYIQKWADKQLIESLQNANSSTYLKNLNDTLENIKTKTIETLGKTNLLEEAKKEINIENIEKINNAAEAIKENIADGIKKFIQ